MPLNFITLEPELVVIDQRLPCLVPVGCGAVWGLPPSLDAWMIPTY
jgi:hypothetical protein